MKNAVDKKGCRARRVFTGNVLVHEHLSEWRSAGFGVRKTRRVGKCDHVNYFRGFMEEFFLEPAQVAIRHKRDAYRSPLPQDAKNRAGYPYQFFLNFFVLRSHGVPIVYLKQESRASDAADTRYVYPLYQFRLYDLRYHFPVGLPFEAQRRFFHNRRKIFLAVFNDCLNDLLYFLARKGLWKDRKSVV